MSCKYFKEKKLKTPFVVSCPKLLCCHETQLGLLGVDKPLITQIWQEILVDIVVKCCRTLNWLLEKSKRK